jgi:hypothetical protein
LLTLLQPTEWWGKLRKLNKNESFNLLK